MLIKKIIGLFMSIIIALSAFSISVSAETTSFTCDTCSKNSSKVVYKSETGTQVVEFNSNGELGYAIVAKPEKYQELTEEAKEKAKLNKESITLDRVNFTFAETLSDAKQVADTNNFQNSTSQNMATASSSSFWHGSYVERVWDWWYGNGTHVYLSPVDTNYITNVSWVAADVLAGILLTTGVIAAGPAVVLGGILTIAVLTVSWSLQNDDGSIDITAYDNNIYPANCVYAGQYLGQAKGKGIFHEYYWPSFAPTYCN